MTGFQASLCRQAPRLWSGALRILSSRFLLMPSIQIQRQSTSASLQPNEDLTPVRVGDVYSIRKRFNLEELHAYNKMIGVDSEAVLATGKPVVNESLIFSRVSACGARYFQHKNAHAIVMQAFGEVLENLYEGEELETETTVADRKGRHVKMYIESRKTFGQTSSSKLVARSVWDVAIPKGHPE